MLRRPPALHMQNVLALLTVRHAAPSGQMPRSIVAICPYCASAECHRAGGLPGLQPPTVWHVSMALQCVREAILSAETVPWLTTSSRDPY